MVRNALILALFQSCQADRADYVLANPRFNVNGVDKDRLEDMVRFDANRAPQRFPLSLYSDRISS